MKIESKPTGAITAVGLPKFAKPEFSSSIHLPADITAIDAANVSELIGKFTLMLCYAQNELSSSACELLRLERKLEARESQLLMKRPAMNTLEKWRKDALVKTDEEYSSLLQAHSRCRQAKELWQMYVVNYERCIAALSRELTRKTATQDGMRAHYARR